VRTAKNAYFKGHIFHFLVNFCLFWLISSIFGTDFDPFCRFSSSDPREISKTMSTMYYYPSEVRFAVYTLPVFSVPKNTGNVGKSRFHGPTRDRWDASLNRSWSRFHGPTRDRLDPYSLRLGCHCSYQRSVSVTAVAIVSARTGTGLQECIVNCRIFELNCIL
jgi:hypothetical protein